MNLKERLQALLGGKKIRRRCWKDHLYLYMEEDTISDSEGFEHWQARVFEGDDWEIYREPVKYSKEIYVRNLVEGGGAYNGSVSDYLFGFCVDHSDEKETNEYKKYRVTVEEVVDG